MPPLGSVACGENLHSSRKKEKKRKKQKKIGMKGRNIEGGIAIVVSVKILICIMQFYDNCSVVIAKLVINQFESANLL